MKTNVHTNNDFAKLLKDAIQRSPYTEADVAKLLGVSKGAVSNWVKGKRKPRFDTARRIFILLNFDLYYTIGTFIPEGELRPNEQKLLMRTRKINDEVKESMLLISSHMPKTK